MRKRRDFEERFWSKVEKTDTCWLMHTHRMKNGYALFWAKNDGFTTRLAHRISYVLAYGPIPDGLLVDHKYECATKHCVRPDHLRLATHKENSENHTKVMSNNTSGYRGVSWQADHNAWKAYVAIDRRTKHVGYFSTAEEAAEAAHQARLHHFTRSDGR